MLGAAPGAGPARLWGKASLLLPGRSPFLPDIGLGPLALAQGDGSRGLEVCHGFPPSVPFASLLPSLPPHQSIHTHCEMVKQY